MQIANRAGVAARPATSGDEAEVAALVGRATLRHLHSEWRLDPDSFAGPGCAVVDGGRAEGNGRSPAEGLQACLVASADPPPAAWVRLAALAGRERGDELLARMLEVVRPQLRAMGADILGWLLSVGWPSAWLDDLGFEPVNQLTTYVKRDERLPAFDAPDLAIRPAQSADLAELARIEAGAFDPLWRHSESGLAAALEHARTMEVAEMDGELVAFQYSVEGYEPTTVHLVRITVRREAQGLGVGSALLAHTLRTDWSLGYERVTLNTQLDNHHSRRLYHKFGFREIGEQVPVWCLSL